MSPKKRILLTMLLFMTPVQSQAIDHKNLDDGRPLRIEDPYPIAGGEISMETGLGLNVERENSNRALLPIQLLFGALPNFQLGLGTTFFSSPLSPNGNERSGDVGLSFLYNFNQEALSVPAFGIKGNLDLPSGVGSSGINSTILTLIEKSLGRLTLIFNGAISFVDSDMDRDVTYRLLVGASHPLGAPRYTRVQLIGDIFTDQAKQRSDPNTFGMEAGVRYQFTQRIVLDTGAGTEFSGPEARSSFYFRAGASFAI